MSNQVAESWIDDYGQPVVSVQLVGLEDPVVALINTGFNGESLFMKNTPAKRIYR